MRNRNRNIEKVCSNCGHEDVTVDRNMFDGMCADCTNKVLNGGYTMPRAKENNEKIKNGYMPWLCPCESTTSIMSCGDDTCDGIYFWVKELDK